MHIVLIPGTFANSGRNADQNTWWLPGSSFSRALIAHGFEPLSFAWSTALDGVIGPNTDWEKAAEKLYNQCRDLQPVTLISHSHGGQIPFFASNLYRLKIKLLITMATPVRPDVPYGGTRTLRERWVHIYGGVRDYTQLIGELALFRFSALRRQMPLAEVNIQIPECGHSDLHTVEVWDKHRLWVELERAGFD